MAVKETSFGGWRMAWREFKEKDIDPYRDFKELRFGGTHDAVVYAVRDGKADAGTVRTDTLETMEMEGKINLAEFRVIHEHEGGIVHLPFLHSTRSYPEWPFAKVKHTPDELAEKVATALLEMPRDCAAAKAARCAGWTIPDNYQSVHECLKELKVGPYKNLGKITFSDVFKKYREWMLAIAILFAILAGAVLYILRLNRGIKGSEKRYRTLIESSTDAILMLDNERNIVSCNKAFLKFFGYREGEVEGKSVRLIHVSDDSFDSFGQTAYSAINEYGYFRAEWEFMHKDGTVFPVETVTSPVKSHDGTIKGYIAIIRDIAVQKRTKEELGKAKESAEAASLAKSEFWPI